MSIIFEPVTKEEFISVFTRVINNEVDTAKMNTLKNKGFISISAYNTFLEVVSKVRMYKHMFLNNFKIALEYIDKHGMPDVDSYSLTKIIAENKDDLCLKMHLATAPVFKAAYENLINPSDMYSYILPLTEALIDKAKQGIAFPAVIEVSQEKPDNILILHN